MKTNGNEPANVVDGIHGADAMRSGNTGLTKREHFAAMAMQGMLCDPNRGYVSYESAATECVNMADALITALNKPRP